MTSAMVLRRYDTADIHVFDDALCEVPELVALRDRVVALLGQSTMEQAWGMVESL